jgi:hypothetical protein
MDESRECIIVAKKEFTSILLHFLYAPIYQGIKSMWNDSKNHALPKEVYQEFQNRLTRVRKWNQDIIDHEYNRIVTKTKCEWLNNLITRIFIVNTQILAATNMNRNNCNIKVKVPPAEKFIHCCYMECARSFFENALLMEDRPYTTSRVEQSKNLQKSYKLIRECIENTIRNLLPIENIVNEDYSNMNQGVDATPLPQLYKNLSSLQINNGNIEMEKGSDDRGYQDNYERNDASNDQVEIKNTSSNYPPNILFNLPEIPLLDFELPYPPKPLPDEKSEAGDSINDQGPDLPIVKEEEEEKQGKYDLDVDTEIQERNKGIELKRVPPIDNFDTKSFFSDAEE